MREQRSIYKRKIQAIVEILGDLVKLRNISRDELAEMVKRLYSEKGIEPFRGRALPSDIYDKELASLYIVGKYGLGLDEDYPELFRRLFYKEMMFEEAISSLMRGDYSRAREILEQLAPENRIDSNTVARMLRVMFTKALLGFESEENLFTLLKKCIEAFPEEERTIRNYVRFYIAFKTAEAIARGVVRDKLSKELFKQGLLAKMGFEKILPGDEYIREIAASVFRVDEKILSRVLSQKKSEQ